LDIRKQLSESGKKGAQSRWLKEKDSPPISLPIDNPISLPNGNKRKKEKKEIKKFTPPNRDELIDHMANKLDEFTTQSQADLFLSHYNSNGWKVGKNSMKDWKAAASGWIMRMKNYQTEEKTEPIKHLSL
jgi:hypothetical protein